MREIELHNEICFPENMFPRKIVNLKLDNPAWLPKFAVSVLTLSSDKVDCVVGPATDDSQRLWKLQRLEKSWERYTGAEQPCSFD